MLELLQRLDKVYLSNSAKKIIKKISSKGFYQVF